MTTTRRFGTESSKTRGALLEAAETLMREEGYASVTARRIANKAGLKFQLVHYYFRTIDELFLALLRRIAQRNQSRFEQALVSIQPLRAIWEIIRDPDEQLLTSEFMALANHRKAIRVEIAIYNERLRSMQIQLLSQALERRKVDLGNLSTAILSVLMASIAQYVEAESSISMSIGHAETLKLVEHYLQELEPLSQPSSGMARSRAAETES